jgi:hypothetical protein
MTMPSSSIEAGNDARQSRESEGGMIRGLQITIRGEDLSNRIGERIRMHEATMNAIDTRITQRAGDLPFDVRPEDGFKTLGELENERQHFRDRVLCLTLLRDNVVAGETYVLDRTDLRLAELISPDCGVASEICDDRGVDHSKKAAIEGLKLTMSGEEARRLLEERIDDHQHRAQHWKREQARTPEQQTEDEPLLPDEMCANEAERHTWRADVLGFIHDHIDTAEVYRLGEADLAFGELLPEKPWWVAQEEYEERNSVRFHLEQLAKKGEALMPSEFAVLNAMRHGRSED